MIVAKPKISALSFHDNHYLNLGMVRTQSWRVFCSCRSTGFDRSQPRGRTEDPVSVILSRTRVILHVIDMSAVKDVTLMRTIWLSIKSWKSYNLRLMERPQLCANKWICQIVLKISKVFKRGVLNYDEFAELPQIFPISSLTKQGLSDSLRCDRRVLDKILAL